VRRQAQGTVSSIDPFATPNPDATEDGGVPAVGVGGDVNTSLLPSLTDPAVTSEAAAFATATDSVQAAEASTVVTDAASTTADAAAQQTSTESAKNASANVSTLEPTASAVDPNAAVSTTILPIGALTNAASSTPVDAGAQQQTTTTVQADTTIQTTLETTAVDSAVPAQNTVVTDQLGQTLALASDLTTTQIAGVTLPTDAAEQPTSSAVASEPQATTNVDSNAAQGTSVVDVNTKPDSPTEAPEVTIVFVTASPTFSGPTAGLITLDSNGNVIGSTSLATDPAAAQATDTGVTASPTTQVAAASTTDAAAAEQTQSQDQQLTTTTIFVPESSSAPSGTLTTTVFDVAPSAGASPTQSAAAASEPQPQPQPGSSQPTAAAEAPAATSVDGGITIVPVTPGNAAADTTQPLTTAAPVPTGLVIGQVLSGQVVTVTETVTETVTAG
jgi:hypothetical protein